MVVCYLARPSLRGHLFKSRYLKSGAWQRPLAQINSYFSFSSQRHGSRSTWDATTLRSCTLLFRLTQALTVSASCFYYNHCTVALLLPSTLSSFFYFFFTQYRLFLPLISAPFYSPNASRICTSTCAFLHFVPHHFLLSTRHRSSCIINSVKASLACICSPSLTLLLSCRVTPHCPCTVQSGLIPATAVSATGAPPLYAVLYQYSHSPPTLLGVLVNGTSACRSLLPHSSHTPSSKQARPRRPLLPLQTRVRHHLH